MSPNLSLDLEKLRTVYRDGLLEDTVPFWLPRSVDDEFGGYFTCLDQDGSVLQTDKAIWFQGRMAWMFATLFLTVEKRPEWLEAARSGITFLTRHGFDTDGRMFFSVTREGRPLRKRRYLFSECFAVIALAAYGEASGETEWIRQAEALFAQVLHYHRTPGLLPAKTDPATRPTKGLAMPMILLATAQELRKRSDAPLCREVIDESIAEIRRDFLKPEFRALLETVRPTGEWIDNFEGRCINPGHSLEAGWFILEEARLRGNAPDLLALGTTIIDWSLELGWDEQHGGLFYFRDARGLPCTEYWHDMKFWWPHNEGIIATLLAFQLTGEPRYADWHRKIHDWSHRHFPDREKGEWFGYLHRDGSLSTRVKGTMFKGFFHLPRMQWYCWQRLEEMIAAR
ncbi:MAG TPA: AGE family epimerase/isomerase [Chthoniobacteraceae bacterium]|nr:AGE family epimerase/isomerase [Chthoniobacteraceae bacterium]